jgi:hypothetical protein
MTSKEIEIMKTLIAAALALLLLNGCTGDKKTDSPVKIENTTEVSITEYLKEREMAGTKNYLSAANEADCTKQGGTWDFFGKANTVQNIKICRHTYPDAGKSCTDGKDCGSGTCTSATQEKTGTCTRHSLDNKCGDSNWLFKNGVPVKLTGCIAE